MNTMLNPAEGAIRSPHSARNNAKPLIFYYANPKAKSVSLIGEFNAWHPGVHPMRRRVDGWWFVEVTLTHGHHPYRFLVDGVPTLDPLAMGITQVDGEKASVIAVS